MAKTLLLSMPYGRSYGKIDIKDLEFGVPPVGLAYVASYLKEKGEDVKLVDLMFSTDGWAELKVLIESEAPRWIGISATTPQVKEAFMAARIAKEVDSDIGVVMGGIHASALPEETLGDENVDIVVYGEGELTMLELVQGRELSTIEGIFYRSDGEIRKNPPRPLVEDIDTFPYPLYEDLPVEKYGSEHFGAVLGIISSRGCPHQCVYCAANTIHGRKYRARSVENVMGEIEKLQTEFGANRFSFYDDTFTLDEKRTLAICEALIKSGLNMEWNCITRADNLTKPLLETMRKAGCTTVQIGVESGDDEILRLARRGETIEDAVKAIRWSKEVGMKVVGLFIVGLPYDTKETIAKTIDIAKRLEVDYAQFSVLIPLPGSEVWNMAREGDLLKIMEPGWESFGRYGESIISLRDVTRDELSTSLNRAYREFYLRPSYILKALSSVRNLHEFSGLAKRGLALAKFLMK